MGIWDDWFGNNPPPYRQYSAQEIFSILAQDIAYQKAQDPVAYEKKFGTLTPYEVAANGLNQGSPEGAPDPNNPDQIINKWTQDQVNLVENSRRKAGGGEDVPPPPDQPPPETPPDTGGDTGPPPYSGPTARQELDALLPSGFEKTRFTSATYDPFVENAFKKERSGAQGFIANALKRGQLTESGSRRATELLGSQDPDVRSRLQSVADTLLGTGQSQLQAIANEGRTAAGSQSGEFFDPTPYGSRVDQKLAELASGAGSAYGAATPAGPLYNTSGFLTGGGGVTGSQNVILDPYASEGGQLKTGLSEEEDSGQPKKKRTTAVF